MVKAGGLLNGGADGGSGTAPTGFMGGQEQVEDETPNVDPEEQQQYDMFVKNGMELLYTVEGKIEPEVLKRLSTGKKPIDVLAQTLVWLVMITEQDAERQGATISDDVVMHGALELLEHLIEVAETTGLHKYKEAERQGAWYQALDMYREANSGEGGRFNQEEATAAFEALNEADKEGRADEVIPGFEQGAERAFALAKADQNEVEGVEEDEPKTLSRRDTGRG